MLVRCMLPISLVENKGFKEYILYMDPSFSMPTRSRIKDTGLPDLKINVCFKIKEILSKIKWLNTSIDGWTDATMRSFNGYVAQGIDDEWNLQTIPIAFEYVKG